MLLSSRYLSVEVGLKGCTTNFLNANVSKTKDHTSMHIIPSTIIFPNVVMLSKCLWARKEHLRQHTGKLPPTHNYSKFHFSHQFTHPPNACLWTVGGRQSTRRETPPTTHTHTGRICKLYRETPDPTDLLAVRLQC